MKYFVQLSEDDRSDALRSLDHADRAFEQGYRITHSEWPCGSRAEADIPPVKGVARIARLSWSPSSCNLGFSTGRGSLLRRLMLQEQFSFQDPFVPDCGASWIPQKLAEWRYAFDVENVGYDAFIIDQARAMVSGIISAAAEQYRPSWFSAWVRRGPNRSFPEIVISYYDNGRLCCDSFSDGSDPRGRGRISQELVQLLVASTDDYQHVQWARRGTSRGAIVYGKPSCIEVQRSEDPLQHMRHLLQTGVKAEILAYIRATPNLLMP